MKLFTVSFFVLLSFCIEAQYVVSTFSGTGVPGLFNGGASSSQYKEPWGMCLDSNGVIYLADKENNCIRKIEADGSSSIYAGTAVAGYADGPMLNAQFNNPINVCFDNQGGLLVADFLNQRIRRIFNGTVSTIAGSGIDGYLDGPAGTARFNYPRGIDVDANGNIYVADSWNHRIRKIDGMTYEVSTYAGGGTIIGVQSVGAYVDASDTSARFYVPCGLTVDANGDILICDTGNHRIRKIDAGQNVTTIAGSGPSLPDPGTMMDGSASTARLAQPTDLHLLSSGELLISDTYNNAIRMLDSQNDIVTLAGNGNPGFVNGQGDIAEFNSPRGVVAKANGDSIFVAERFNHRLRLIKASQLSITGEDQVTISVYPNPCSDKLWIAGVSNEVEVQLVDTRGLTLLKKLYKAQKEVYINTEKLNSGFYYLTITSGDGTKVTKPVIINK